MEVINGLEAVKDRHRGAVVALGNFDGVHLGHKKILGAVAEIARKRSLKSLVITFEPHPMRVLVPERGVKMLTPPAEKARLMERYGMDALLFIEFTRDFARLPAEEFITNVLVGKLGAKAVVVGHAYAFGKGKKGTTALLRKRGAKYGFAVKVVRNARVHGDVVSSSRVRGLLLRGRVCEASMFLGRPYAITGTVVRGAGRGGKILETPTANVSTAYEILPREGVYAVRVSLEGKIFEGVANIGTNPTFSGAAGSAQAVSCEAHILDYAGDVTGKTLTVHFIDRLRDEKTFPDANALREQIARDIAKARDILSRKWRKGI